jgi:uncharacterized protein
MSNQLAQESSPYLLQHVDNPVHWYPWGEEALARAQAEEKPILLSVGYAACHWCHVMAHESFEDEETAAYMNAHFINIKVDREERPDIDAIYMSAVVAMSGQGGWPMTVFLTPDGDPFFGGTYFPPFPRYGMPSFRQVMESVSRAWQEQRDDIEANAQEISQHIGRRPELAGTAGDLDEALLGRAMTAIERQFEPGKGGFGRAPKFPQPMTLEFLLRMIPRHGHTQAQHMLDYTLEMMAQGGIYDHLGGGFARYATDNDWLVPHFEKMLYDNALLSRVYLHAWQLTGRPLYKQIVTETLDYVIREMRHEAGGFYSSQDADSEGEEGKFYVWQPEEIRQALGDELTADIFMLAYDVTEQGNWEGKNILNVNRELSEVARLAKISEAEAAKLLASARQTLYEVRSKRVWPGLDDKALTAWNGLMLAAFAEAGRALGREDYTAVAVQNAEFLYENLRQANGRLWRAWKAGHEARYNGYLEDYAYLGDGLLALYQTTFDLRWFNWAQELAELTLTHFYDEQDGGFFDTADDHETLIYRPKDLQDNAVPSGNAMACHLLLQLGLYTGDGRYHDIAQKTVAAVYGAMSQYPTGFAHWLCAAAFLLGEPQEVAIIGEPTAADTQALLAVVRETYRPHLATAVAPPNSPAAQAIPLLANRDQLENQATAYVCRQFACQRPVNEAAALREQLNGN